MGGGIQEVLNRKLNNAQLYKFILVVGIVSFLLSLLSIELFSAKGSAVLAQSLGLTLLAGSRLVGPNSRAARPLLWISTCLIFSGVFLFFWAMAIKYG
jgi:hypothetical protein